MTSMRTVRAIVGVVTLLAGTAVLSAAPAGGAAGRGQTTEAASAASGLAGAFLVTATFTDPPDLPPTQVLITFAPGRDRDEGTLVDTNQFQLTPNPVCSPDQGVWRRAHGRQFIATHYNFCFDADNGYEPAGPTKIRDRIVLAANGESFTGTQYIEGFDPDGTLVFTATATLAGERLHAEPPPQ